MEVRKSCVSPAVADDTRRLTSSGARYVHAAILHNWGPEAIQIVIDSWPSGATTFDPDNPARVKKMKKPSHTWARFPRKTAEAEGLAPAVLELLPAPMKKKGKYIWVLQGGEKDGVEVDPLTMKEIVDPKAVRP